MSHSDPVVAAPPATASEPAPPPSSPPSPTVAPGGTLAALFHRCPDGILHGRVLLVGERVADVVTLAANPAFESLVGRTDLAGRRVSEFLPGYLDTNPDIVDLLGRVARTGVAERIEIAVDLLRSTFAVQVYCPASGEIVAVVAMLRPEGQTLPAMRARDSYFHSVIDAVPIPVGVAIAATGAVLYYNRAFTEQFGYTHEDIPSVDDWRQKVYPDPAVRERMIALWAGVRANTSGAPATHLIEMRCKDGSRRQVELTIRMLAPWAIGTLLDVTAREMAQAALARTEERHRLALDAAQLGTWRGDLASGAFDFDARAMQHVGAGHATLTYEEFGARCHPEDRPALFENIARMLDPSGPGRGESEQRVVDPSGEVRWIATAVKTLFAGAGAERRPVGVIGTTRDTTDQRRAEQALRATEDQLRAAQKMEAVGRLAGGVAHDFNNLLTVIRSYAELAIEGLEPDALAREDLGEIELAARRAEALTRQLLAFSRRQVMQIEAVDLEELVSATGKMLQRLIGEDVRLAVRTDAVAGGATVRADRGQLEQVLINLVVNARDAMPTGGALEVAVRALELDASAAAAREVAPGRHVELRVSDTGHGMDLETQARVFEPFFTTKGPGKGTGLGLATVYGIVRQSGGAITLESAPGRGTTFRIVLPWHAPDDVASPAARPEPATARAGETVLVVDDESAVREVVRRVLVSAGYEVLVVGGGAEALALCEKQGARVRLVLTDVVMPEMNGRQLAERLAPLCPRARVVFMSGYADEVLAQHEVLGAHFVRKPFDVQGLARRVREVLDEA